MKLGIVSETRCSCTPLYPSSSRVLGLVRLRASEQRQLGRDRIDRRPGQASGFLDDPCRVAHRLLPLARAEAVDLGDDEQEAVDIVAEKREEVTLALADDRVG